MNVSYLKLNKPTIEIETQERAKSRDVFYKILFVGIDGGSEGPCPLLFFSGGALGGPNET